MKRRTFVRQMCAGGLATFALPSITFAQAGRSGRFVFVLLRGGFDGLAALVPHGDPSYAALRGAFAFSPSDLVELNDTFGLAPGLAPLREFWDRGELVAVHAMAIPYRTRSHFDGQAILETGLDKPVGSEAGRQRSRTCSSSPGRARAEPGASTIDSSRKPGARSRSRRCSLARCGPR